MQELVGWLRWLLALSAVGWAAFPLAYRLLRFLPGRGLAFARPLGLLIWGYLFWLLGSLGILQNNLGGVWLALALLVALGWWARRGSEEAGLAAWLSENRRLVIAVELVFVVSFSLLCLFRAMTPEIRDTEKPMELAFINSILRSPTMPPHDPWLADYAISYYYFGYVMTAMLARLAAVPSGIAFNLMIASVFAMAAAGAYGLVADLLAGWRREHEGQNLLLAIFAPVITLVLGNVEGLLEFLHVRGAFWRYEDGELVSRFWTWLDIKDLVSAPALSGELQLRFWWWWRASRVITDRNFAGDPVEVIDEFPWFSYYLADLHPHVIAMPFAMLALALGLNYYLGRGEGETRIGPLTLGIDNSTLWLSALLIGGMAFLNIWDFPIYLGFLMLVYAYVQAQRKGWALNRLMEGVWLGIVLAALGVLLYLPYHIGFSSQAGGILPNLINPTRGAHLWVMFGTLFFPLLAFLFSLYWRRPEKPEIYPDDNSSRGFLSYLFWRRGRFIELFTALLIGLTLVAALWAASLALALGIAWGASLVSADPGAADLLAALMGAPDSASLFALALNRRLAFTGGWLTLALIAGLSLRWLLPRPLPEKSITEPAANSNNFAVLLIFFGALLVLAPEFFYLRDQFGHRMNTVFKFFIQGWLVWGVAGAYGLAAMLSAARRGGRAVAFIVLALVVGVGSIYTLNTIDTNFQDFRNSGRTLSLNGTNPTGYLSADDQAAVAFLLEQPLGTLVEAVGGSYTRYARISAHSGQPSLLGWPGHESQWRGGGEEMGSRAADIERLYSTVHWEEAANILAVYDIRYIYVGDLERTTYSVYELKFVENLPIAFQQGSVTLYAVPPSAP
ncbi:MAG: hypothetical protein EPO32_10010 [Anaerolineae bacterium]|nr:MAG: hypothetical protein EPO32_10010 [Anaerolineae bacterium]